jgi:Arc/MetJ-type ribon-helix-helix transcriptional regulator
MSRVPVVVSDEQKQRWSEFADQSPEMDNVSDLIRTSVETHIARQETEDNGGWTEEEIDTIIEYLDSIESTASTNQALIENFRDESPDSVDLEEALTYQRASIQQIVEEAVKESVTESVKESVTEAINDLDIDE